MFSKSSKGLFPTYHLPPNFSIGPAPHGPIQLGSILNNLRDVKVLNAACRLPIDEKDIYLHRKKGFSSTLSHMRKGELGVWARAVGLAGLGGALSWSSEISEDVEYKFGWLDTSTFSPSAAYIRNSMKELDVSEFVEARGWAPVYIVTGIKVAIEPSVRRMKNGNFAVRGKLGISQLGGLPVEVGPRTDCGGHDKIAEGWESSDDFIFGLRVEKLVYKHHWLHRKRQDDRALLSKPFNKGAQLVGESDDEDEDDEDRDAILKIELEDDKNGMKEVNEVDDEEETVWIVPASLA
ncbi:hypothetical protein V8C35DRAFT_318775 [Trichoderma chlorosporum]